MPHEYGQPSELEVDTTPGNDYEGGGGFTMPDFGKYAPIKKIQEFIRPMTTRIVIHSNMVFVIMVVLVLIVIGLAWRLGVLGGFANMHMGVPGSHGAFDSLRSDKFSNMMKSTFMGDRSAPHFSDVTNTVLRSEDREKEAVRALGKINQERLRRASEDSNSTTPLPWEPFWKEWKATHPMESDGGHYDEEGFSDNGFNQDKLVPY